MLHLNGTMLMRIWGHYDNGGHSVEEVRGRCVQHADKICSAIYRDVTKSDKIHCCESKI